MKTRRKSLMKRGLSFFIAMTMCLSMLQMPVFAAEESRSEGSSVTEASAEAGSSEGSLSEEEASEGKTSEEKSSEVVSDKDDTGKAEVKEEKSAETDTKEEKEASGDSSDGKKPAGENTEKEDTAENASDKNTSAEGTENEKNPVSDGKEDSADEADGKESSENVSDEGKSTEEDSVDKDLTDEDSKKEESKPEVSDEQLGNQETGGSASEKEETSKEGSDEETAADVSDVKKPEAEENKEVTDTESLDKKELAEEVKAEEKVQETTVKKAPVQEQSSNHKPGAVKAFLDAVAAIPEITPDNAEEAAEYIYGEVAEAYEELLGTEDEEREDVQAAVLLMTEAMAAVDAALEMESEMMALIKGEQFTVNVVKVVNGVEVDRKTLTQKCLQSTGHSGDVHSTNLRTLANLSGFSGYKGYNWSPYTTVPSTYTSGWAPNNNYTSVHYNITGKPPYKADETLFLFFETSKTFTLNYNANGGSGAPASQTASSTESSYSFTISNTEPTREDYDFLGWSTSSDATTPNYHGEGTIDVTGTTTLYAVWEKKANEKVTLTYDANGGQDPPSAQTVDKGENVTVKDKENMTYEDYTFLGWNTDKNAVTADWMFGDGMKLNTNVILYAVWEKEEESDNPKEAEYTVEWYDTEGNSIKETETRKDTVGKGVEVTKDDKVIEDYTFKDDDIRNILKAELKESGTVLKLYFTKDKEDEKNVSYQVKWYDTEGNSIKETETRNSSADNVGKEVEVIEADKKVEGYTFEADNENNILKATLKESGTVLKLYFTKDKEDEKNVNYQVKWYDTEGNSIKETETRNSSADNVGKEVEVTEADKKVEGYTFEAYNENNILEATLKESGTVLKLYFTKNSGGGNTPDPEPKPDPEPEPDPGPGPGPSPDPDPTPTPGPTENKADYNVEWYDADTNEQIKESETRSGVVDSTVSVRESDKAVAGYTFAEGNGNNVLRAVVAESGDTRLKLYFTKNGEGTEPTPIPNPNPERKDAVYTVIHEYYTNNVKDGENTQTVTGKKVGDTISAADIERNTAYEGNTYNYVSSNPGSIVLTEDNDKNVVILRYDRTVSSSSTGRPTGGSGGSGSGGGGGSSTTNLSGRVLNPGTPESAVTVPGDDVPLADIPESTDIRDEDVPLAGIPMADIPDADVPLAGFPGLTGIPDEDVPLASVPKTGDNSGLWHMMAVLSAFSLLAVSMLDKKKRQERN